MGTSDGLFVGETEGEFVGESISGGVPETWLQRTNPRTGEIYWFNPLSNVVTTIPPPRQNQPPRMFPESQYQDFGTSGFGGEVPGNFGNSRPGSNAGFGGFGSAPGGFGSAPGGFGSVPGNFGSAPGNFGSTRGNLSSGFPSTPANFGGSAGQFGNQGFNRPQAFPGAPPPPPTHAFRMNGPPPSGAFYGGFMPGPQEHQNPWEEVYDSGTDTSYWVNTRTNQFSWTRPF